MKVLLVYPNQPAVATQPPLGLMYIASMLRFDGHQVQIIEGNAESIQAQYLAGLYDPDYIGITCMSSMYSEIIKMRDFFHNKAPLISLIFGGVHATILPESLLDPRYPDYVVQGEGELTILEIVNGLSRPGILQGQSPEPLDDLPFPARDLVDKRYLKHSVSILAARGCPFNCSFCQPTLRKVFGEKVRRRSPNNVRSEMWNCYQRFRVEDFEFFDDTFTADKNWVYDFCDLLDHFFFKWKALSRVDMLDFEILERMKEAGLTKLSLGIESGSQEILNSYSKGTTVEQNDRVLKWCEELGIKVHGFFMIGALEETEKSIKQTRQFIRDHKFDTIFVTITTPTPCTRLYDRAEKEGRLKVPWDQFNLLGSLTTTGKRGSPDQLVPMKLYNLSAQHILDARNKILKEFYLRKTRNPLYLFRFIKNNGLDYTWEAAKNVFN
jgi:anaerobic magnesium-protoporphyrin IX monomethyl ester cyclase